MDDFEAILAKYPEPQIPIANKIATPYDGFIEESASKHNIDSDFVKAVIGQESSWKPNARSPKNASGLMQLMPATARNLGVKNIYDPKENIEGGTKYLRQLLDMFGGDVSLALAGYNAGEGAVQKYGNKIPPYRETQAYVQKITGNYKGKGYRQQASFDDLLVKYPEPQDFDAIVAKYSPTKEPNSTIQGQIASANDPNVKTRFGVLSTDDSQSALFANEPNFKPFPTENGTLWLNTSKIYADKKLKLKNEKDLAQYVAKNPKALTTLIGITSDVGTNTSNGTALTVTDPVTNIELASAVVPNGEAIHKQAEAYADQFPHGAQSLTTTDEIAAKRDVDRLAEDERAGVAEPQPDMPDAPVVQATDADFNTANDYLKSVNQPLLTREQFDAAQGTVGKSAQASGYSTQVPKQKVARPTLTKQPTKAPQEVVAKETVKETPKGDSLEITLTDKPEGQSYSKWVEDKTIAGLASKLNVEYDTVARALRKFQGARKSNDIEADESYYEGLAKQGDANKVQVGSDIIAAIRKQETADKDATERITASRAKLLETNPDLDVSPEMLDVMSAQDAGLLGKNEGDKKLLQARNDYIDWLVAKGYAEESAIKKAFGVTDDKPLDAATWALYKNPIANLLGFGKPNTSKIKDGIRKDILDDIQNYGSLSEATKVAKKQAEQKAFSKGIGQPTEFIKRFPQYLAKAASTAMEVGAIAADMNPIDIGYELLTGKETGVKDTLMKAAKDWREYVDKDPVIGENPAYSKDTVVKFGDVAAQLATQMITAPFTGGASLALPLAEGATAQFREADTAGANRPTRLLAATVGAALATPDVLMHAKYLKGLDLPFIDKLTKGLFSKLSKEMTEQEARELTKVTVGSFVKTLFKNSAVAIPVERQQEWGEDIGNKLLAKLTYKPNTTWEDVFVPTSEEQESYNLAGLAGLGGATVETAVEKMSDAELQKGETDLAKMLADKRISETDYKIAWEAAKKEIATRIKRGTYFAKDAEIQREVKATPTSTTKTVEEPTKPVAPKKSETEDVDTLRKAYDADPLTGLKREAINTKTFEEFERGFTQDIKHGVYYHFTADPNFSPKDDIGSRDMSSMGDSNVEKGSYMVTSHPELWDEHYNTDPDTDEPYETPKRGYVAVIDLADVPKVKQVNRGFGNEIYLDAQQAKRSKVIKVLPVAEARKFAKEYFAQIPQSKEELKVLWDDAHNISPKTDSLGDDAQKAVDKENARIAQGQLDKLNADKAAKAATKPVVTTNAKGNINITVDVDGQTIGELKTQRNDADKALETVSVINARVSENQREQGIATQMYETLLDNLPTDIKGIRLSDVTTSDAIPAIYKKLGAVKVGDELIIPNPKYKPRDESIPTPKQEDVVRLSGIIDSKGDIDYAKSKDVAGRIERGEATIRRLNPAGERGRIEGGKRAIEATIILAGNERSSEASRSRTRPVERQERALEDYAKREGIWLDANKLIPNLIGKGNEASVYSADGKSVQKVIDYKQIDKNATPLDFIDNRIATFNHIFPETKYELVGFTRTKDGFRFVIEQPFIQDAVPTTPAERQAFMKSKGFDMVDKYGEEYANKFYHVSDLHEKNALKKPDGTILVIDAVTKAKPVGNFEIVDGTNAEPIRERKLTGQLPKVDEHQEEQGDTPFRGLSAEPLSAKKKLSIVRTETKATPVEATVKVATEASELADIDNADLLHDYLDMVESFGATDKDVQDYKKELDSRGVDTNFENYTKTKSLITGISKFEPKVETTEAHAPDPIATLKREHREDIQQLELQRDSLINDPVELVKNKQAIDKAKEVYNRELKALQTKPKQVKEGDVVENNIGGWKGTIARNAEGDLVVKRGKEVWGDYSPSNYTSLDKAGKIPDDFITATKANTVSLLENAQYTRKDNIIQDKNSSSFGVINQLAKMAMSGHQPSLGFTVQPHQIKAFKDAITYVQERTNGKAKRTIDKIANDFEKASKFGKKPTVIFALTPDAIPHEMVHDARIQAMVANTIEESHSDEYIDKVVSSPLFAKSSIGKLYAGKDSAIQAIEFTDALFAEDWAHLGLDPVKDADEIAIAALDAIDDFKGDKEQYGTATESITYILKWARGRESLRQESGNKQAESSADSETATESGTEDKTGQARDGTRVADTVEQTEQRQEARDDSADVGAVKKRRTTQTIIKNTDLTEGDFDNNAIYYTEQSQDANATKAEAWLNDIGFDAAYAESLTPAVRPTAFETAKRMAVIEYLDQQIGKHVRIDPHRAEAYLGKLVTLSNAIPEAYTEYGQAIAQLARWAHLNPENIVAHVANKLGKKGQADALTVEDTQRLKKEAKEVSDLQKQVTDLEAKLAEALAHPEKKATGNFNQKLLKETKAKQDDALKVLEKSFGKFVVKPSDSTLQMAIEQPEGKMSDFSKDEQDALITLGTVKWLEGRSDGNGFTDWQSGMRNELAERGIDPTKLDSHYTDLFTQVYTKIAEARMESDIARMKKKHSVESDEEALTKLAEEKEKHAKTLQSLAEAKRIAMPDVTANKARESGLKRQIANLEKQIETGEKPVKGSTVPDSAKVVELKAQVAALRKQLPPKQKNDTLEEKAITQAIINNNETIARDDVLLAKDRNAFYSKYAGMNPKDITNLYLRAVNLLIEAREMIRTTKDSRMIRRELKKQGLEYTDENVAKFEKELKEKRSLLGTANAALRKTVAHLTERPATRRQRIVDWYLRVNGAATAAVTGTLKTATHNLGGQKLLKVNNAIESIWEKGFQATNWFAEDELGISKDASLKAIMRGELPNFEQVFHGFKERQEKDLGVLATLMTMAGYNEGVVHGVLAHNPDLYDELMAQFSYGTEQERDTIDPKLGTVGRKVEQAVRIAEYYAHVATFLNRVQEKHFRFATFKTILRSELGSHGYDLDEIIASNDSAGIPRPVLQRAVNRALEDTLAQRIPSGSKAGQLMSGTSNALAYVPFFVNPLLFRTFFYNSTKFMVEHSPLILGKLLTEKGMTSRDASKLVQGFVLYGIALSLLANFGTDDDDPTLLNVFGKPMRMSAYNPLAGFLVLANIPRRLYKGKTAFPGHNIPDFSDVALMFGIDGRYPNPAYEWYKALQSDDDGRFGRQTKVLGGKALAMVLRPFSTLKDIEAEFQASIMGNDEERIVRDYSDEPFIGELKKVLPISEKVTRWTTGENTPARENVMTGEPEKRDSPLLDQLGFTFVSESQVGAKMSPAEEYLNEKVREIREKDVKYKTPEERRRAAIAGGLYTAIDKGNDVSDRIDYYEKAGRITADQAMRLREANAYPSMIERKASDNRVSIKLLTDAMLLANPTELEKMKQTLKTKANNQDRGGDLNDNELAMVRMVLPDYVPYAREIKSLSKQRDNTTDAKQKEALTKQIETYKEELQKERKEAKETKIDVTPKEPTLADKVRSGEMDKPTAKQQLNAQFKAGEISYRTYQNSLKSLDLSKAQQDAKELNTASEDDFAKLKVFLDSVPDKDRASVLTILQKKIENKDTMVRGQTDKKTANDKAKLQQIVNEWKNKPRKLASIISRPSEDDGERTKYGAKMMAARQSENVIDLRPSSPLYPIMKAWDARDNNRFESAVRAVDKTRMTEGEREQVERWSKIMQGRKGMLGLDNWLPLKKKTKN